MTETQMRDVLERATEEVTVPPDLLARVRAGGRRRVLRRRTVLAGAAAVVAGGVVVPLTGRRGADVADEGTTGDLAGDRDFLAQVESVWRRTSHGVATHGPVRIRWAGTTPAGPVAWVWQAGPVQNVQSFVYREDHREDQREEHREEGRLRVSAGVHLPPDVLGEPAALLVGEQRDTLVVAAWEENIFLSESWEFGADGRVRRTFAPIGSSADGVRVIAVRPQRDEVQVALRTGADRMVALANIGDVVGEPVHERVDRVLPGGVESELERWDLTLRAGYVDEFGYHVPVECWLLIRGDRLAVQVLTMDGRGRVFWMDGEPHYLGALDSRFVTPGDPIVLHVRLPGDKGVVVAALGARLRFRTGGGSWLPVKGDAALLPAAATMLEVTGDGGDPVTVRLS